MLQLERAQQEAAAAQEAAQAAADEERRRTGQEAEALQGQLSSKDESLQQQRYLLNMHTAWSHQSGLYMHGREAYSLWRHFCAPGMECTVMHQAFKGAKPGCWHAQAALRG